MAKLSPKIQLSMAAKVLRLRKGGSRISDQAAAAARRVIQSGGNGSESDVQMLRNTLGIARSGSSSGFSRSVGAVVNATEDLYRDIEDIHNAEAAGRSTGPAMNRFFLDLNHKAISALKSQAAKATAEAAGKLFKKIGIGDGAVSGLRSLSAMTRGLKLAGALGGRVAQAFEYGEKYFDYQRRNAAARGQMIDTSTKAYGYTQFGQTQRSIAERLSYSGNTIYDAASDVMAGLFGIGKTSQEKAADILRGRSDATSKIKAHAQLFGIDANKALTEYARAHGLTVNSLSPAEVSEALNREAEIARGKTVPENYLDAEYKKRHPSPWLDSIMGVNETQERARLREELENQQTENQIQAEEKRKEMVQFHMMQMLNDPQFLRQIGSKARNRLEYYEENKQIAADWNADFSRRQQIEYD